MDRRAGAPIQEPAPGEAAEGEGRFAISDSCESPGLRGTSGLRLLGVATHLSRGSQGSSVLTRPDLFNSFAQRDTEPVTRLTSAELMEFHGPQDMPALRRAALRWYQKNLQGTSVVNEASGRTIIFGDAGVGKTVSAKGEDLLRLVPALREILARGRFFGTPRPDRRGRLEIKAIHTLSAKVSLGGRILDVVAIIRETRNGEFYYDLKKDNRLGDRWALLDRSIAEGLTSGQVPTPALEGDAEPILNIEVLPESGNLDPFFAAQAEEITAALAARLQQLGISDRVAIRLRERIDAFADGRSTEAEANIYTRG